MYIVRRPFKSLGKYYVPGTILTGDEPIKRFKSKLVDKKILPIPTDKTGREELVSYFNIKHGTELTMQDLIPKEQKESLVKPPRGEVVAKPRPNTPPGTKPSAAEVLARIKNQ